MVFLIVVLTCYLAYVFGRFVLTIIKIIVIIIKKNVNQVYTYSWSTSYCTI